MHSEEEKKVEEQNRQTAKELPKIVLIAGVGWMIAGIGILILLCMHF